MAKQTRSSIMAFKEETTEGELIDIAAASEFVPLREGFSLEGVLETVDSDELVAGDVGASKSFATKESPTASYPFYFKHSGVEGQAPELSVLYKAMLGSQETNATEYDTVAGSTVSVINVDTGEGANFNVGEALLIKDATNGYSIRNVASISSDALTLNFDLDNAPAALVNLGKSIFFKPATGNPTFSAHRHQAASGAAFKDAMAGVRVSSMTIDLPANDLGGVSCDMGGIKYYYDQIRITAGSNDDIDFTDDGGTIVATLAAGIYSPKEMAREIQTKMQAAADASGGDDILCTYSDTTGKFTISTTTGTLLSLLWNTGVNTATGAHSTLGYSSAADDTGALTYDSDNAQSFDPAYTPTYDSEDPIVVKGAEILIGDSTSIICKKTTTASFAIETPKTDVPDICSTSGVDSSIINERNVTFTATLILEQYEADLFDKFINNTTTQVMLNAGPKSSGNWQAGKAVNIYMGNMSVTAMPIGDQDGYQVLSLEAKGFVSSSKKDVYLNFL